MRSLCKISRFRPGSWAIPSSIFSKQIRLPTNWLPKKICEFKTTYSKNENLFNVCYGSPSRHCLSCQDLIRVDLVPEEPAAVDTKIPRSQLCQICPKLDGWKKGLSSIRETFRLRILIFMMSNRLQAPPARLQGSSESRAEWRWQCGRLRPTRVSVGQLPDCCVLWDKPEPSWHRWR